MRPRSRPSSDWGCGCWLREDILWRGTDLGIIWVPVLLVALAVVLGPVLRTGWVVRVAGALGILYIVAFVGFLTLDFGSYIFYVLGLGPWMMLFASSAVFLGGVVRMAGPPGRRRPLLLGNGLVVAGTAIGLLFRAQGGALGLAIPGLEIPQSVRLYPPSLVALIPIGFGTFLLGREALARIGTTRPRSAENERPAEGSGRRRPRTALAAAFVLIAMETLAAVAAVQIDRVFRAE